MEETEEKKTQPRKKISPEEKRRIMEEKMKTWSPQKKAFEKRRLKGYRAWLRKKRAEIARRKKKEKEKKEKERLKLRKLKEEQRHKRKPGRPKKRGPKKKWRPKKPPQKVGRKKLPPIKYEIVTCLNGVQKHKVGKYRSIEDAYEKFNTLKEEGKNVIFPMDITGDLYIKKSIWEYLLIEKIEEGENNLVGKTTVLRNEYGKLVEQRTNNKEWRIIDKIQFSPEETFWVWGFSSVKKNDRKTFAWIFENKVINGIEEKGFFKRIFLFLNKIVIKDDNEYISIVFCKNESDAIRFYNLLELWVKKYKIKQVLFFGDYASTIERKNAMIDDLTTFTGLSRRQIAMTATTYYSSTKKLIEKSNSDNSDSLNSSE